MTSKIILVCIFLILAGCKEEPKIKQEKEIGYALGYQAGKSFHGQETQFNIDQYMKGFRDGYSGKEGDFTDAEMQKLVVQAQIENQRQKSTDIVARETQGKEYLEKNATRKEIKTLVSGIQYEVFKEGEGEQPKQVDRVTLYLKGMLMDGTVFVDDFASKKAQKFSVIELFPGLRTGVQHMKVGSRYRFYFSPEQGHGLKGADGVPPQSVVIYDVDLVQVTPSKKR